MTNRHLTSAQDAAATPGDEREESPISRRVGGKRGAIDGGLPPILFVATNAVVGMVTEPALALRAAAVAAASTGLTLVGLRLMRRETLKQALRGLVGVLVAVLFAAWSGEARDFFRPGIYVDAAYAVLFAGSALVGRPLVGVIHAALYRAGGGWRRQPRLRRVFTVATLGWALVYGLRTSVQAVLYRLDQPEFLALAKLMLGWPLTVLAVALTLASVRRATARNDSDRHDLATAASGPGIQGMARSAG